MCQSETTGTAASRVTGTKLTFLPLPLDIGGRGFCTLSTMQQHDTSQYVRVMRADVAPTLPTRTVLNSNLSWVRGENMGDLDSLHADIKERGLQLPILLMPDFQVIDGARRLLTVDSIGHKEVPVFIATEWGGVVKYYKEVRRLAAKDRTLRPMPMGWYELDYLIGTVLFAAYGSERTRNRLEQEKSRQRGQVHDALPKYNDVMADVLGIDLAYLRRIREAVAAVRTASGISAEHEAAARRLVQGGIDGTLGPTRMIGTLRDLVAGRTSPDGAMALRHELSPPRQTAQTIKPDEPRLAGLKTIQAIVDGLATLSDEASRYSGFDKSVTPDMARQFRRRVARARKTMTLLVRQLANTADDLED